MGEPKRYDYLIVGAGLFGSVFAYEATKKGKTCLVIDKRNHIGGNIYTEEIEGINVHKYGAHIFHTKNKEIWEYMQQFAEFNNFINCPIAKTNGEVYNLPFNMNTFSKMWDISTPAEAKKIIETQKKEINHEPANLEEQAISLVGRDIYEKLIKEYTEKQWGRKCKDLPPFIIKRIPIRFTYDNNYFDDEFQGIPIGGYTKIIEKMLEKSDVELNCDFFNKYRDFKKVAKKLVYTGKIDEFFDYTFGHLEYRSLDFKTRIEKTEDYQGVAVVNYTDKSVKYTRTIEHKHFEYKDLDYTIITEEYPLPHESSEIPYYPINDYKNDNIYHQYEKLTKNIEDVAFGGRLGEYKYYNMDEIITQSKKLSQIY